MFHVEQRRLEINQELEALLPKNTPPTLYRAMKYSLLAGGKRIRPLLCLMTTELFSPQKKEHLRCACALEYLHTYTLIHDDLPCMDDDNLRRGKPTLHKAFSESTALLAGDALLNHSFSILAHNSHHLTACTRLISDFADLAGAEGVIGGQILDLEYENKNPSEEILVQIHLNKTAKLILASVRMGCFLGEASEEALSLLSKYAENIGLAFQISDDILDEVGDSKLLGKNTGQDQKRNKTTYPKLFGLGTSQKILHEKIEAALSHLHSFSEKADPLRKIAHHIQSRRR